MRVTGTSGRDWLAYAVVATGVIASLGWVILLGQLFGRFLAFLVTAL
jgi:hypothetical protein